MPSVVIVGAGVIGTSIAYHLAARGVRDVVVLDRGNEPGAGSTPRATGGFRAQFATAADIALSLLSREKLIRFSDEIGVDSGYRPYGYLFIARSEQAMAQLRIANELQHACGLPEARVIDAEEVCRINPAVVVDDAIVGGTFCPTDGFIRAMKILGGYFAAAQRLGVRFEFGVTVRGMRIECDRIAALETSRGDVHADVFINAAGAWAGTLGVDIPVAPLRRQVAATVETDVLADTMPMTVWADDGFHFRVRDRRVLLLWPDSPPSSFDVTFDPSWMTQVLAFTNARIPLLRDVPIDPDACWAGLYEMSPDHHAILGRAPALANLYLANGCSGHGVMHAPAIGQVLSELILDGRSSIDIHSLRASRFAEGEGIVASALL
ncbi:MAG TPA: FAD-dependent oxidoreductase [Thermoanaerobaculia bacterium]|jgi:sarcosine oxidase subunit beta|nr:FAD-dependent oxidoreductase [Thermoanaerobaculia bacterium]